MNRLSVILLTLAAFSAAGGQLLFKIGASDREQFIEFINIPILDGLLLYGTGTLIWIYTLSYEKLINVYAFTALTFVLVYLGGIFIINEKITTAGIAGILLVIGGAIPYYFSLQYLIDITTTDIRRALNHDHSNYYRSLL